ncbi:MAG: hypothetical protein AMXMBFR84_01290 [Candidatus Hydrogenedentota bacterium]
MYCRPAAFLVVWALLEMTDPSVHAQTSAPVTRVSVVLDTDATPPEILAAGVLKRRVEQVSEVTVEIGQTAGANAVMYLGVSREAGTVHDQFARLNGTLPGRKEELFPEGYAVKSDGNVIVAVGVDARGVLYAVGEIVRQLKYAADSIAIPVIDVQTAPAFRYRGFSANQGGTMMKITGARGWTEDELHDVIMEYALAGGNTFYASDQPSPFYDWQKSHGFMTVTGARPNQLRSEFPPEWKAAGREGWEGNTWVCPSIPEARAALIKQWEEDFGSSAFHDVMRFYAGDPGGCTCDQCTPWGKTFVEFCEELAAIWLKHHPGSTVQIANQGLDNAGDQAIFDYLNEKPRTWSYGICYGPGSNAMSPYFRDIDMRDDLFAYPGQGPVNRYVAEIVSELPADQRLVHYSDITHWISAQYMVEHPEPHIVKAYGRRTFHARPKAMYWTFQAIMPFSEGDIIYSEGNHDEFHQYLWARLLWDPNRSLDDVMTEYCTLYFGEEAAPEMVQALFQLESSLEASLAENPGIEKYYALVKSAGEKMPAWRKEKDYRWRLHMQKAALDRYNQWKLRAELDKEARIRSVLEPAIAKGPLDEAIEAAQSILNESNEMPEMAALREEARVLGEETNARHGDRNPGYFKLDQPFRDLPGIQRSLDAAKSAQGREQKREHLKFTLKLTEKPTVHGNIFW